MDYLQMDAFTLRAEIIELRRKPTIRRGSSPSTPSATSRSIPTGASVCGRSSRSAAPTWVSWSRCAPCSRASVVVGGSSDHCILDVEDCPLPLRVGDVIDFRLCYSHVLYATGQE